MTEEELRRKCKERAKIFQQAMESCHSSSPIDCIEWFADRIAELEEKLANADYQLEGRDNEIRELKEKIEKMKCCGNCRFSESDNLNGTLCHREGCFVVASGEKCKLWEN
jgi:predicted ATP-binding protein involved in virulence